MGFNVGAVLKTLLPNLAAALPGPPLVSQMATNAISSILGVKNLEPSGVEKAIADAQAKDPEIMLKLKQADQDFQLQMEKLGIDSAEKMEELASADRANARGREIAIKDNTNKILAYLVVGLTAIAEGYFGYRVLHGTSPLDPSMAIILGRILGTLDTSTGIVLAYYFGSSSGSAAKTDILGKMQTAGK